MNFKSSVLRSAVAGTALALALPFSTAFAATIPLHNPGTGDCSSSVTNFHLVAAGVSGDEAAPTSASLTFQYAPVSGTALITRTITLSAAQLATLDQVNKHEVGITLTPAAISGFIAAQGGTALTAAQQLSLVLTGGSITFASGIDANNFNISDCPLPRPSTTIPEVPLAALFPLIGGATFAAGYGLRRLRRRPVTAGSAA